MRRWRRWVLAGAAVTLAASGVGVAMAGEQPPPDGPPIFPDVVEEWTYADDPSLLAPRISAASITCDADKNYTVSYSAATQPGTAPKLPGNQVDGALRVTIGYRYSPTDTWAGYTWGVMPMKGDAGSTADAPSPPDGWLGFGGSHTIPASVIVDDETAKKRGSLFRQAEIQVSVGRYRHTADGYYGPEVQRTTKTNVLIPHC